MWKVECSRPVKIWDEIVRGDFRAMGIQHDLVQNREVEDSFQVTHAGVENDN